MYIQLAGHLSLLMLKLNYYLTTILDERRQRSQNNAKWIVYHVNFLRYFLMSVYVWMYAYFMCGHLNWLWRLIFQILMHREKTVFTPKIESCLNYWTQTKLNWCCVFIMHTLSTQRYNKAKQHTLLWRVNEEMEWLKW